MERFMYLFRDAAPTGNAPSPEEMQASMQKWLTWIEGLRKSGNYEGGEPLLPEGKQIAGSKKVITDGPFTESKELVSGFFLVTAKDLNHATELARSCPIFESGGRVEIRPVQKVEM